MVQNRIDDCTFWFAIVGSDPYDFGRVLNEMIVNIKVERFLS